MTLYITLELARGLRVLLSTLREHGSVKPSKLVTCIGQTSVQFLGHSVSYGTHVASKVLDLKNFLHVLKKKQVRSLIGLISYYRALSSQPLQAF